MLKQAQLLAKQRAVADRTEYWQGDFVSLAPLLPQADVTVLDKVVCCYPDPERLIGLSLEKTRRLLGLTFPRNTPLTRIGVGCMAWVLKRLGSSFRPYVHDPDQIESMVHRGGFQTIYRAETANWLVRVFDRRC